ncbi:hypothetical protein HO133_000572 [Letharia lupina]|uniref:Uncharacterized protein n=1 Tax=Letharia lupina TaxID=560253 RepID=A0A8H6FDD6_9LECA|nr:uncharacterized protein HO133_000572 [Letharia lupina]KAF6223729.1 hypothetical protein HO133_000572 [Letharia lupina]
MTLETAFDSADFKTEFLIAPQLMPNGSQTEQLEISIRPHQMGKLVTAKSNDSLTSLMSESTSSSPPPETPPPKLSIMEYPDRMKEAWKMGNPPAPALRAVSPLNCYRALSNTPLSKFSFERYVLQALCRASGTTVGGVPSAVHYRDRASKIRRIVVSLCGDDLSRPYHWRSVGPETNTEAKEKVSTTGLSICVDPRSQRAMYLEDSKADKRCVPSPHLRLNNGTRTDQRHIASRKAERYGQRPSDRQLSTCPKPRIGTVSTGAMSNTGQITPKNWTLCGGAGLPHFQRTTSTTKSSGNMSQAEPEHETKAEKKAAFASETMKKNITKNGCPGRNYHLVKNLRVRGTAAEVATC